MPQPEGPVTATNSPSRISRVNASSAVVSTEPVRYTLRMFRSRKKTHSPRTWMQRQCVIVVIHYQIKAVTCKAGSLYNVTHEKVVHSGPGSKTFRSTASSWICWSHAFSTRHIWKRKCCRRYGSSRSIVISIPLTVSKAYKELAREGFTDKHRGEGLMLRKGVRELLLRAREKPLHEGRVAGAALTNEAPGYRSSLARGRLRRLKPVRREGYQNPVPQDVLDEQIRLAVREASDLSFVPDSLRHFAKSEPDG